MTTVLKPTPNPQAGGPLFVDCRWLFIQCVRRYLPYMEAVTPIHKVATELPFQRYIHMWLKGKIMPVINQLSNTP
jgi:hypothetical protein